MAYNYRCAAGQALVAEVEAFIAKAIVEAGPDCPPHAAATIIRQRLLEADYRIKKAAAPAYASEKREHPV